MAYKDKEKNKEYNKKWYEEKRKNNPDFKKRKKEYDREYHKDYKNPNLTPEKSREYNAKHRKKNPELTRERSRRYKRNSKEKSKLWVKNNPEKIKKYRENYKKSGKLKWLRIKNRYGITKEEYLNLLILQNNLCPICKNGFDEKNKEYVDHCHISGIVRGIIHRGCNILLGFANDRIDVLENGIKYLKKHKNELNNKKTTNIIASKEGACESIYEI